MMALEKTINHMSAVRVAMQTPCESSLLSKPQGDVLQAVQ